MEGSTEGLDLRSSQKAQPSLSSMSMALFDHVILQRCSEAKHKEATASWRWTEAEGEEQRQTKQDLSQVEMKAIIKGAS